MGITDNLVKTCASRHQDMPGLPPMASDDVSTK